MGWCSATDIFDSFVEFVINHPAYDDKQKIEAITKLATILENEDWDCQSDSNYYGNPLVQTVMKDMHPRWFEEE